MLTTKWIAPDGTEVLDEAMGEIVVTPFSDGAFNNERGPLVSEVRFRRAHGSEAVIHTGQVFVMTSAGKTIDRYYLAGVPPKKATPVEV
jgi:hypothetical protein